MRLIQTMIALMVLCGTLLAQEPPATSPGTGGGQARAEKVRSPEVLADGRITFRLLAPKATEVLVQGNWEGGRDLAMTKDSSGLWSVTAAALQPELWAYTFSVDGVRTLDPGNYNVARDGVGFMNTVLAPGEASAVFQTRPVPHGSMTTTWFQSTAPKAARRMIVYTPPGYEEGTTRYPVLYLLHGSGGDEGARNALLVHLAAFPGRFRFPAVPLISDRIPGQVPQAQGISSGIYGARLAAVNMNGTDWATMTPEQRQEIQAKRIEAWQKAWKREQCPSQLNYAG